MTATLVPVNGDLAAHRAPSVIRSLQEASLRVEFCTADEALDGHVRAQLVSEMVRIQKLSEEIAAAALLLEAQCLRRIAQLNAFDDTFTAPKRFAGRWMASLDDEGWQAFLATLTTRRTVIANVYAFRRNLLDEELAADRPDDATWEPQPDPVDDLGLNISGERLWEATENVIDNLGRGRWPRSFTVNHAATELLRYFGLPDDSIRRTGAIAAVRQAIKTRSRDDYPAFVTYRESQVGFVHLPWETAQLRHFRMMVEIQDRKAQEAARRIGDWRRLLGELDRVAEALGVDDTSGCHWLSERMPS